MVFCADFLTKPIDKALANLLESPLFIFCDEAFGR